MTAGAEHYAQHPDLAGKRILVTGKRAGLRFAFKSLLQVSHFEVPSSKLFGVHGVQVRTIYGSDSIFRSTQAVLLELARLLHLHSPHKVLQLDQRVKSA